MYLCLSACLRFFALICFRFRAVMLMVMFCEGVVKSIGVSNYTREHLEEMLQYCRFKPAVLQVVP